MEEKLNIDTSEDSISINDEVITEEVNKYDSLPFNKTQEELVDILCSRTGANDRNFFRVMVSYKFSECASMMRTTVNFSKSKFIPVNMYALDLAPSGYSKNASMNVLDKEIFKSFRDKFTLDTMPTIAETNLALLADDMSISTKTDVGDCYNLVKKEYSSMPRFLYSFGDSTPEGLKTMRSKLSMAGIGCTSNVLDEIGSNLQKNKESFTVMLEAYDTGDGKQKLIKTDGGNGDLKGSVPSCLFAFGTQSKLLDGCSTEKEFFDLLETGYARRFIIGFVEKATRNIQKTAREILDEMTNPMIDMATVSYNKHFESLADKSFANINLDMDESTLLKLIDYRIHCDTIADNLKEHQELLKAVIKHSYWRALKLAGAYAFIEKCGKVNDTHIDNAIALCEEGIKAFKALMQREKPYVRLAKYISEIERKVTQVDLVEDLVFYKGSESQKKELMNLAIAYGYNNNIIIKRTIKDGIEFLEGESLKEVELDKIKVSYSNDITTGYKLRECNFNVLHQLVTKDGFHYCSHNFNGGHRKSENAVKGFNLLILDVDSGLPIETCKSILEDYTYLIATTKRHTDKHNRYRIILPMNYELKLDAETYKKFMKNVFKWLPFESDEQTSDIARKWSSHKGDYWYNAGKLFDVLPFIPDTSKEVNQNLINARYDSVEALQKWFLLNFDESQGRNNMLIRYALALLDSGMVSDNIRHSVYELNKHLTNPLQDAELESTIMKTIIRKEMEREIK